MAMVLIDRLASKLFLKDFSSILDLSVFLPRLPLGLGGFSSIDLRVSSATYPRIGSATVAYGALPSVNFTSVSEAISKRSCF